MHLESVQCFVYAFLENKIHIYELYLMHLYKTSDTLWTTSRNWLFLEKILDYLLYITWSVPWNYRWICIPKQDTASNVELSNNETHLFQNGECSNEVEYHPRAILYAFARVRVSWSCVWICACGVRCLLSAKLQNELGKLMQLWIYLWDLYHRQWCVSWVVLSVLLVELGMTCVLVWGNWFWSVYTT